MKRYRYYLLSAICTILLTLTSCGGKGIVPASVIQPKKMVQILEDVSLLEGYFSAQTHFHYDTLTPEMIGCYDSLFAKYEVTKDNFDSSFSWYSKHPEAMQEIIDSVNARLAHLE